MTVHYGHWVSDIEFCEDDYVGFIYIIENKITTQKYIGKKNFRINSESPKRWKVYESSSKYLKKDIKLLGKDNFIFTIIHLCKTKEQLADLEIKLQIERNVLEAKLPSGLKEYYNRNIHDVGFDGTGTKRSDKLKEFNHKKLLKRKFIIIQAQENLAGMDQMR